MNALDKRASPALSQRPSSGRSSTNTTGALIPCNDHTVAAAAAGCVATTDDGTSSSCFFDDCDTPVVRRSAYIRVSNQFVREKVNFLRENLALRQQILTLEMMMQRQKEEFQGHIKNLKQQVSQLRTLLQQSPAGLFSNTITSSNPMLSSTLTFDQRSMAGGASSLEGQNQSETDALIVAGSSGSIGPTSWHVTPSAAQLTAVEDLANTLADQSTIDTLKEEYESQLQIVERDHKVALNEVEAGHEEEVKELQEQISELSSKLNNTLGKEELTQKRYRQEALENAREVIERQQKAAEKAQEKVKKQKEEIEVSQAIIKERSGEVSRQAVTISQMQQQISLLREERQEMRAALIKMSQKETQLEETVSTLQQRLAKQIAPNTGSSSAHANPRDGASSLAGKADLSLSKTTVFHSNPSHHHHQNSTNSNSNSPRQHVGGGTVAITPRAPRVSIDAPLLKSTTFSPRSNARSRY